jgi:hypothetical protein
VFLSSIEPNQTKFGINLRNTTVEIVLGGGAICVYCRAMLRIDDGVLAGCVLSGHVTYR